MWLFCLDGFFSAVEAHEHPGLLAVRARYEKDIKRLCSAMGKDLKVIHTPERDYPYRVFVEKEEWAEYVKKTALEINYSNFKNASLKGDTSDRHNRYFNVWKSMNRGYE